MFSMDKTCKRQTRYSNYGCISNSEPEKNAGHAVLSISIKELSVLHSSYMPFLTHGGLFIPTTDEYEISDEVFLLLKLIDGEDQIAENTKVAWITPMQTHANRPPGIGLQFLEKNSEAKKKIENYLAGMESSARSTWTL
jgi:type IV pilus assembly protein PilZ